MQKQLLYILLLSIFHGMHSYESSNIKPNLLVEKSDLPKIQYVYFREIEDFPRLGYEPKSRIVAIRITRLFQAHPPLAYESLIPNVSTSSEHEDRAFKPNAKILLVREFVSRALCGYEDCAGNRTWIQSNPKWEKAPHQVQVSDYTVQTIKMRQGTP